MSSKDRTKPIAADRLTPHLKTKSTRRRDGLNAMAAPGASPRILRNDVLPTLELVQRPLERLVVPARNVRKIDPAHIREVAASISVLGFRDPVLIDQKNNVIDGAIRVEAARLIGLTHIPCIDVGHLDAKERRLLRMALNRLGEKGEWDLGELKIELEELILDDASIEIPRVFECRAGHNSHR